MKPTLPTTAAHRLHNLCVWGASGLVGMLLHLPASATDLVYTPVIPAFGGSPLYGSVLLSTALAQNSFRAPTQSPLQNFNSSLQQAILNRLTTLTMATLFGPGNTLVPGTYETQAYTITVVENNGVLTITTTDKKTWSLVSFDVSKAALDLEGQ